MKKIITLLLLLTLAIAASAQLYSGNSYVVDNSMTLTMTDVGTGVKCTVANPSSNIFNGTSPLRIYLHSEYFLTAAINSTAYWQSYYQYNWKQVGLCQPAPCNLFINAWYVSVTSLPATFTIPYNTIMLDDNGSTCFGVSADGVSRRYDVAVSSGAPYVYGVPYNWAVITSPFALFTSSSTVATSASPVAPTAAPTPRILKKK